ncbi:hypothetical protein ALI144C_19540 [Actinosynnema sp. ALI-1.44]|uniref:CAP domain-containing protein n=1 Tax=Actinosynnema sp. ALI-1.44 TaxID=1933779 RepID=UPI00097BF034|nr:CAP domain-containing protein [Actinosynnema sp. ALI-1.44]ONI81513.1 hypothetical protein ALI144C_19540 [Actinosynnema sp. ALI-1.44]
MSRTTKTTRVLATGAVLAAGLLTAPAVAADTESTRTAQDEVVHLTNAERQKAGCPPLTPVATLNQAAQAHTADMAAHGFMDHTGSDGSSVANRVENSGYTGWRSVAENVAAGQPTAAAVVSEWMASSGHRTNILNCALKDIGVGYATSPAKAYGTYWTQDFGTR